MEKKRRSRTLTYPPITCTQESRRENAALQRETQENRREIAALQQETQESFQENEELRQRCDVLSKRVEAVDCFARAWCGASGELGTRGGGGARDEQDVARIGELWSWGSVAAADSPSRSPRSARGSAGQVEAGV